MPSAHRLVVAAAALTLAACQGRPPPLAPLPPPPQVVDVTTREYRFDYAPPSGAGPTVFRVTNAGGVPHQLDLLPLAEDVPPLDVQLKGTARRIVTPFAGMGDRQPGQRGAIAVDLKPGVRYGLICFLVEPDGQSHARSGMTSEFRVPGPPPAEAAASTTSKAP